MLPLWNMSMKKAWLLFGCYPGESCQWRNTDYWSNIILRNHVGEEIPTTGRMLSPKSCQLRNTDYCSDITLVNDVSDEILTTGRILPSLIMSVTKHWLLVGSYPPQTCQWRNTDYSSDVNYANHVSKETVTTGRMLLSVYMSVTKLWLMVGRYGNHSSAETLTICQISPLGIPSGIMSVKKR